MGHMTCREIGEQKKIGEVISSGFWFIQRGLFIFADSIRATENGVTCRHWWDGLSFLMESMDAAPVRAGRAGGFVSALAVGAGATESDELSDNVGLFVQQLQEICQTGKSNPVLSCGGAL